MPPLDAELSPAITPPPEPGVAKVLSILTSLGPRDRYPSGALRSVTFTGRTIIKTALGELTPNYEFDQARKKYAPSVTFYESGAIKTLRLAEKTIVPTPLGPLPAEKLAFYESGALKRLFPVDGRLSGFWSLNDEKQFNQPIALKLKFASARLYLSVLSFYPSGQLRSACLWPNESLLLPLPGSGQRVPVGAGFSLYPDGALETLEPAWPALVPTPAGPLLAHDPEATGLTADRNSLALSPSGQVISLKTLVIVQGFSEKGPVTISPRTLPHPLSDSKKFHRPLTLSFSPQGLSVSRSDPHEAPVIIDGRRPVSLIPYFNHKLVSVSLPN
ncbi:MAG: hypothetical protein LBE49_07945 [Deltaproteobacteria bacterium]|jgi:hypothetical protein|nr:hypothetical protein [Deltaproteobacteria bacterium]